MKIYQVSAVVTNGVAVGYVSAKKDIPKMFKKLGGTKIENRIVSEINFTPTKKGIVQMLNLKTPQMDNG